MKRLIGSIITKAPRLPSSLCRILALLCLGVFLKAFALIFWDIGSATLLISSHRLQDMGIDFIGTAVSMAILGIFIWKLDRRKGRGTVRLMLFCVLLASGTLYLYDTLPSLLWVNTLFILKYLFFSVLTIAFWAFAKRFIEERFSSLKFLSLFCLELASFSTAGTVAVLLSLSPFQALVSALFCLIALTLVFKTIDQLAPVPDETFIRKTDGIQDIFDRPLVMDICLLSFLGTGARALIEAILYTKLAATGIMPITVLGLVWTLFGLLGLFMVGVLYHTRYIYTTLAGMLIFGLSIIFTGWASFGRHSGPVASGYLMFLLGSHFYLTGYMRLLPRILSGGVGTRLKKRILTFFSPLGFVLCGSIYLNLTGEWPAKFLIGLGFLLILITLHTTNLYSQILHRAVQMRLWRKGPLMLANKALLNELITLIRHHSADDVIYALTLFKAGNHPLYDKGLKVCLYHSDATVRRYALVQMRSLYNLDTYHSLFQKLFHSEKDVFVRQALLCNLILSDTTRQSYDSYLKDKQLCTGALDAFLSQSHPPMEKIVSTLEAQLNSSDTQAILSALSVIKDHPDPTFIPLAEPFLKHASRDIVRLAILTAGTLKAPSSLPFVLRALDDARLQEAALIALKSFGKTAFPPIEKMIKDSDTPDLRRKQLILFLGSLPSGEGKQILLRSLTIENQKLRKAIVQNILDSGIIWVRSERKNIIRNCLHQDLDRIGWLLHLRETFLNAPTHESEEALGFFLRALQEDITDTRELILYQLLLLETNDMFTHAVHILLDDAYDLYLPAMGVVQDLLPNRLYQRLKPVLILPLAKQHKDTLSGLTPDETAEALSAVLINPPHAFNHWIRATALYALRRLGSDKGLFPAEESLNDPHPIVLEAAVWTLVRLQPDKKLLHQQLLKIPTSRLSQISLDKILES